MLQAAFLSNKRTGKLISLVETATLVGRDPKLRLCLNDPGVSRRHAVLVRYPEEVRLSDLGSRNGVYVNGEQIQGDVCLGEGDLIQIGMTVLIYHDGDLTEIVDPGDADLILDPGDDDVDLTLLDEHEAA